MLQPSGGLFKLPAFSGKIIVKYAVWHQLINFHINGIPVLRGKCLFLQSLRLIDK